MFTSKDIKRRIKRQPFVPIRIVTSSGEKYDVMHPDLIMVGIRDIQVGSASPNDPATYDDIDRIALVHITALEDLSVPHKKNGKAK